MARTRLIDPPSKKRRGVLTIPEWMKLAQKALQAAEKAGDSRRARIIQTALREGNPSKTLKRLGIVCEADILREFGPKT